MRGFVIPLTLLVLPWMAPAQPAPLSVSITSREETRQFYRAVYHASSGAAMQWSGNYATGSAGDTAAAFKEATRLRVNFFRALVGVPADIGFNATYNAKAQQAALLMSVNNALSHTPPPSWTLYSAVAAEAALNSNLALGSAGPAAIDDYVSDAGLNNAGVGHRRWIFYPQTLFMGSGDVPGIAGDMTRRPANALWVIDTTPGGQFGAARPSTRSTAITYPPAGFVPHSLVFPRWSFSYPAADFSSATVRMFRGTQSITASLEPVTRDLGEPTLVWVFDGRDSSEATPHPRPAADTTYTVNVSNVRIGNAAQDFSYQVTVFDPDVPTPGSAPVTLAGNTMPAVGSANTFTVTKPSFAAGFDWRVAQLTPITRSFTAESGLEGLIASVGDGYDVVQGTAVATGTRAYRLAHGASRVDQTLQLPGLYLADGADAVLTFRSRLGVATATETARVQISTDDGMSWMDLFSQAGTSPTNTTQPASTENDFVTRTISLASYNGRSIALRFAYSAGFGITFVPDAGNTVGWFLDDISLTRVQALTAEAPTRVTSGSGFTYTPRTPGPVALQARGVLFTAFPTEWGPLTRINAVGDTAASTSYLSNLSVRTAAGSGNQTLIVGFAVAGGTKSLLVRGIGPSLTGFGVGGALNDPRLELFHDTARIAQNDNWLAGDANTFNQVGAFGLNSGSRDAALVVALAPGSYTAQVSGANGESGIALVELYDAAASGAARLANVSARSLVGGGDALIAGFTIAGNGPRTLLIRAIGPTLGQFGVTGAMTDPRLELFSGSRKLEENDNWDGDVRSTFQRIGAFDLASGSRDAVLLVTLAPGSYTAQVSGVGSSTGVALIEVYDLP